ncbi:MAG: response regulator [Polyangiaceae bacterium]|nr:response regulator [Polyangiaceae bacterium]
MSNYAKTIVLVADDEPSTRALVSNHLRNNGFVVLEAVDGDDAWELAQEHLPDLIVLDVMMPGMSGWEVCRRVREAVSLAHTGVVMLTGIGESLNEMTSPLYGADAYLDKPFEFSDLDEKLDATLERRRGGAYGRPDGADINDGSAEDLSDLEVAEPPPLPPRRDTVPSAAATDSGAKSRSVDADGEGEPTADRSNPEPLVDSEIEDDSIPDVTSSGDPLWQSARSEAKRAAPRRAAKSKAPPKKAPAKKAPPKKAPPKKAPPKKAPPKKAPPKKAPARKAPAKKAAGRR